MGGFRVGKRLQLRRPTQQLERLRYPPAHRRHEPKFKSSPAFLASVVLVNQNTHLRGDRHFEEHLVVGAHDLSVVRLQREVLSFGFSTLTQMTKVHRTKASDFTRGRRAIIPILAKDHSTHTDPDPACALMRTSITVPEQSRLLTIVLTVEFGLLATHVRASDSRQVHHARKARAWNRAFLLLRLCRAGLSRLLLPLFRKLLFLPDESERQGTRTPLLQQMLTATAQQI
mmetsp:Transcript_7618/g.18691  ORF Transcript_7618/g.18691 Transcript_7618/m.18691 type:complete len:229 (+) Transcript_7618:287-973(+)